MPGGRSWEVCLCSDFPDYEVWCKNFRSYRRARRFMKKNLSRDEEFYCATISNEESSVFQVFYWNGREIIPWDKPYTLLRREARRLEREKHGPIYFIETIEKL